jgi:hypothetical protein
MFRQPQPIELEEEKEDRLSHPDRPDADVRCNIEFKQRKVPQTRQFLDPQGRPQRNLPVYELDEIWEIPDEFEDFPEDSKNAKKSKALPASQNLEKYGFNWRMRNELGNEEVIIKTKYIFEE